MTNFIIIAILVGLAVGIGIYIFKAKKRCKKCIGCPYCKECSGNCGIDNIE